MKKSAIDRALDQLAAEIADREKTIALLKVYQPKKEVRKPRAVPRAERAVGEGKPA